MLEPIAQRIHTGKPLLLDGALGSCLMQRGLPAGSPPEAWVLEHPERLLQLHQAYAAAGADVLTTCTFGANRLRLAKASLESRLREINLRAVELTRQAAGDQHYVAANMGPTGEFLQPHGTLTFEQATEVFLEQAEILAETAIDFFLLETHYSLPEALLNLTACRTAAPHIPVAVTLTCNQTKRGFYTVMGDEAAQSLQQLHDEGAFLVGANCTLETHGMLNLAQYLTQKLSIPLLFQPNAGSPQMTPEGIVYPQSVENFVQFAEQVLPWGVRAIGGCCGTDAEVMRALRCVL